ncbi:Vitelline membrane outer layer protein 1 [Folsomia candida]|uniref:Vitelline membrane outer layer protein 1 n=1 Tax=Folsomia candida TaxID=158441 RepID=A0A226D6H5_FOLCA|nr:Vitelline membrane outer layer protein 1 [Folsomia candida]
MTGKIVLLLGGILAVQSLYITSVPITNWGNYLDPVECPTGSFVTSFKLRTESYRGQAVDDTALNDIEIRCTNPTTKRVVFTGKSLSPHDGWGNWGAWKDCGTDPYVFSGFQLRVEPNQGEGDDTATNNIRFKCRGNSNGTTFADVVEGDGGNFGSWGNWSLCPALHGICGYRLQFEK